MRKQRVLVVAVGRMVGAVLSSGIVSLSSKS